jgi:hypothetical protein
MHPFSGSQCHSLLCPAPLPPVVLRRCEMVLVLLERKQTSGDSPYAMVKQAGDSLLGLRTQCFAADKAGVGRNARPPRGRLQYVANIVSHLPACCWAFGGRG